MREVAGYKANSISIILHGNPITTEKMVFPKTEFKSRAVYLLLCELADEIMEELKNE